MMKKKVYAITLGLVSTVMIGGAVGVYGYQSEKGETASADIAVAKSVEGTEWKEVPVEDGRYTASAAYAQYDMKEQMQESDYVFSGSITDLKQYEVKWTDDEGNLWGPYTKSVIEVKVNKEYHGTSPVSGDSIRVYYPYSVSTEFKDSFDLEKEHEYVFVTRALDEEFVETRDRETPEDKFGQENYADVYITSPVYDVLPKDEDNVLMYHDFFAWDEDVMQEVVTGEAMNTVDTEVMTSPDSLDSGWFIALDTEAFEEAFGKLFDAIEYLPDATELQQMHQGERPKRGVRERIAERKEHWKEFLQQTER